MINGFYVVTEKIKEKKIYIYGIGKDAVTVFTKLIFWGGADISGFIDDEQERYSGKYFMNRPVVTARQIQEKKDILVIIPDGVEKKIFSVKLGEEIEIVYCNDILVPNQHLKGKDVYIYGIGQCGEEVYQLCRKHEIIIKAACVSKKKNTMIWNNLPVFEVGELKEKKNSAFIIATTQIIYQEQMLEALRNHKGDSYLCQYMMQHHISEGRLIQSIGLAVLEKKKIWLYGKKEYLMNKIKEVLQRYSVEIEGEICDLYDLAYVQIERLLIVIVENNEYEVEKACDILDSIGFALEKWNYTSLACETLKFVNRVETFSDILLRWSSVANNKEYPGFIVHGNDNRQDIKIMVLGGSTSTDGVYRTKSWVEQFYERLVDAKYHVTIYNGAACGHGCARELMHLLRDGAYMELDYVISLSGVNDAYTKKVKNFFSGELDRDNVAGICGVESKETHYEFWNRIIKIMKYVTEMYGARFYSFLQPMAMKEDMSLFETVLYEIRDNRKEILKFRELAVTEQDSIFTNVIDDFDNKVEMYIDAIHYSNEANMHIAKLIYETIIKEEGMLKKSTR